MAALSTKYFDVPGAKLAYTESGNGPVVLLLHGNSESKHTMLRYQVEFLPGFHNYAIDSRCHGETISDDSSLSFDQFSDDLLAFCKGLGITSAFVIGYSDGGNLGLFLAKKAPQLFTKVVAISPNYLADGVTKSFQNLANTIEEISAWLGKLGFHTRKTVMRMQLMTRDIGLTDADLQSIATSVTILHAEHDLILPAHIDRMVALIPGCKVELIPDCSHFTILNKPATVAFIRCELEMAESREHAYE